MQIIRQQNARKLHFFDYSLWNHYVKDLLMPLFSAASALSFHFPLPLLPCVFFHPKTLSKKTQPLFSCLTFVGTVAL